jgi:class 3 adenylate cyclase/predicted ATPase
MESVSDWCARLGLPQYAERFAENDVDLSVLVSLTDVDLKELGVASFGHRRKMLAAIAELGGGRRPDRAAPRSEDEAPPEAAERRQLSVMFCDLVGSTSLSARLDPEDMREVIAAYHAACSPIITSYGGFVAKYMGDGILAYFGYPSAHEDDAERAVRTALELRSTIGRLVTPAQEILHARIGIATGLVVVGDRIGEGAAQEQTVVGDTPNLAARLQALAEPGGVIVAKSTRTLIGDRFRVRSLGQQDLKGFSAAVEAWEVQGLADSETRFETARAGQLTGFVGREAESAVLLDRLGAAWAGEGQVVLLSGEPGIGKSRLAAWLAQHVAQEAHTRLRYQCSLYHRDSSLYPFIEQLERAADIRIDETAEVKLAKLEAVLSIATPRFAEIAPLLASLLSIPFGSRYPPLSLSATQQRRQTLAAFLEQLEGLSHRDPVLMLLEDVHWADATSLELVDLAIERVRRLPVLVLITFRPEFEPPWEGLQNVVRMDLSRLDQPQIEALVARVTGGRQLPAEVMAQIVDRTDGVPLFVEELTKTIQESGLLIADGDSYRLDGPLPPLAIPTTLQDSLRARLDRLSPLKDIVQTGAAIGREFSYALLRAVVGGDDSVLAAALEHLEDAELLSHRGSPPDARYTFKHALIRDAAYESLLRSRRQVLHRRIGEVLRDSFPALAAAEPEVVAYHLTQAGLSEAVDWWGKAGDLALRRGAYAEAARQLRKGIDLAEPPGKMAGDPVPMATLLKMQIDYGQALIHAFGWSAPQTSAAFARARELAIEFEDPTELLAIYYGLWAGSFVRGELAAMRETADLLVDEAARRPDRLAESVAHRAAGRNCWFAGDYIGAKAHLEAVIADYDEARDAPLAHRFSQDAGMTGMVALAIAAWPLGEVERARRLVDDAIAIGMRSGHVPSIAHSRFHAALLDGVRGDASRGAMHAEAVLELCREHDMPVWKVTGGFMRDWALWRAGEREAGLQGMRHGLALWRQLGGEVYVPFFELALAEAEDAAEGLSRIDETLLECERTGQHWLDAELHRARGDLLLKLAPADAASAVKAFETAITVARRQGARSFGLRAALRLARLRSASDDKAQVVKLLKPGLKGFAPSPEFPEIAEAEALLAAPL